MAELPEQSSILRLDCAGTILDLSERPAVMGILNMTPDSFSDGGRFSDGAGTSPDTGMALDAALAMIAEGADIIDVGGESTRPGAETVDASEEIRRTVPLISLLRRHTDLPISIDTYKAEVAEAALDAGASMVNDISGLTFDGGLAKICRRYRCGVVLMHIPAKPGSLLWSQYTGGDRHDIMTIVAEFLEQSVRSARAEGIEAVIVDPGFGFGKSVMENYRLLDRLDELHGTGCPVLAGLSRKSFLGSAIRRAGEEMPPPPARKKASIASETIALMKGADIIRTHDVAAAVQARAVVQAVKSAGRREA